MEPVGVVLVEQHGQVAVVEGDSGHAAETEFLETSGRVERPLAAEVIRTIGGKQAAEGYEVGRLVQHVVAGEVALDDTFDRQFHVGPRMVGGLVGDEEHSSQADGVDQSQRLDILPEDLIGQFGVVHRRGRIPFTEHADGPDDGRDHRHDSEHDEKPARSVVGNCGSDAPFVVRATARTGNICTPSRACTPSSRRTDKRRTPAHRGGSGGQGR